MSEPAKQYDSKAIEPAVTRRWLDSKAFAAHPDAREDRYVVMMPLPNVTGALHMGHAMDNVMQDLLTRWHRMAGDNTLWMAGTDHAGIATQSVVETRLKDLEGKTRHDIGREALVERIWAWKDQYQARIVEQQQAMGCGCDWDRQRFTMDAVCARAVRHTFFRMFRDGLIFQGDRLVNWDCHLQTAVADDELYKATVQGKFYYLRYPVEGPQPGEPTHIVVATTRPETMLGDTAVACHGEPKRVMEEALAAAREKAASASAKDKDEAEQEVARLEARMTEVVPYLEQVAAMAKAGRKVRLPLMDRSIPIIVDEWAKPELGTGCVKITPAHDPNDYEVWGRHKSEIDILNVLADDGTINASGGAYEGLDRFEARTKVMADLDGLGLVDKVEDRVIEVDHSDRSKTIVEPYLSKQWFVRMADVDGGVLMGEGTGREFRSPGLAQAALDAVDGKWQSPTGRSVAFHPDPERYRKIFEAWLAEKRDWCISRQLWWGHRIPVWRGTMDTQKLLMIEPMLAGQLDRDDVCAWIVAGDRRWSPAEGFAALKGDDAPERVDVQICFLDESMDQSVGSLLEGAGLALDPDVLDTWFSSALWPHSTLGWPDPATAPIDDGQTPVAASADGAPSALDYYYPGSCLVTGRDIITLWVARMVITGLYNLGDVPFTDVFLHATILDGRGVRMSKSLGNGIDPTDIIDRYGADAMRYVICELQTGTQDVRLPVQAISPFTADGEESLIELAKAKAGPHKGTYIDPDTKQVFDLVGQHPDLPQAKATSDRFEVGRNFCNKLWNAARFALLNLEGCRFEPLDAATLPDEDRWILSRLSTAVSEVQAALEDYNPSRAVGTARDFFWNDLCDWYVELIKVRIWDEAQAPTAKQVLAAVLDQVLRLLHPMVPFITEELWKSLAELAPERGIAAPLEIGELLTLSPWPQAVETHRDPDLEQAMALMQDTVAKIRETRARYGVGPRVPLEVRVKATGATAAALERTAELASRVGSLSAFSIAADAERTADAATVVAADAEIFVLGVVDPAEERKKLEKQRAKLSGQIQGTERKLANEAFVAKAPPEIVEKERAHLTALRQQLESVEQGLAALG